MNFLKSSVISYQQPVIQGICSQKTFLLRVFFVFFILLHLLTSLSKTASAADPKIFNGKKDFYAQHPPVIHTPQFSDDPIDAEFFRAQIFEEPLVPQSNISFQTGENQALSLALLSYFKSGTDLSQITSFIASHPDSRWNGSLLLNLGIVYRKQGRFSMALDAWQQAWNLLQNDSDPVAAPLAGRALAELAELNAWVGRMDELERLTKIAKGRVYRGAATEKISSAIGGLSMMKKLPGESFKCGPLALAKIQNLANPDQPVSQAILNAQSTTDGFSLSQIRHISLQGGMNYQMAKRTPGSEIIYPAVVHWKLNHYSALLARCDGKVLVQDSTFDTFYGRNLWMDEKVLEEEASGYFLVPSGNLPPGWTLVLPQEAQTVWGKGAPSSCDANRTSKDDRRQCPGSGPQANPKGPSGMPQYSFLSMVCSLSAYDIPLGYVPPLGPAVSLQLVYNQREATQPSNLNFSNFGSKWNYEWFSFVNNNPSNLLADVNVIRQGGGQRIFTGFSTNVNDSVKQRDTRETLHRNGSDYFELRQPDGSYIYYGDVFGAGVNRKVMMSGMVDAAGNTVTFSYDSLGRLDHVTDHIGQVTRLYYEDTLYPFQISKVVDPFGRSARFTYDGNGELSSITDVQGMTSTFEYSGDFMNKMTTPYGTSTFQMSESGAYRSIQATDPMGEQERVDSSYGTGMTMPADSVTGDPAGMVIGSSHIDDAGNTFYWDKEAMERGYAGNLNKASKAIHWVFEDHDVVSGLVYYEKKPLEKRLWFNYPGQQSPNAYAGTNGLPNAVGRVLDDGTTTQITRYEYNAFGSVTNSIDPLGRTFSYIYDSSNNLTDIKQTKGGANDLLLHLDYNFGLTNGNPNNPAVTFPPIAITDASGQKTSFGYNQVWQLTSVTNALNQVTTFSYNTNGFLGTITGPVAGATFSMTYDSSGRVRTITDSEGYVLTYDYDYLNHITQIIYPDSSTTQFTYDKLDLVQVRDRKGRATNLFYDKNRHLLGIRDPAGRLTRYVWCGCGSLEKIVDPNGNSTSWSRDDQNRVTSKSYADDKTEQYAYETTTSRLKSYTDPKNQITLYTYNLDDTISQVTYSNAVISTPSVSFTYDGNYPRVSRMTDGNGTTTNIYNSVTGSLGSGRLASMDGPFSNDTISYSYDELGRVKTRDIGGIGLTNRYDSLGRITNVVHSLGSFSYSYVNATARLSSMAYPNGQKTEFSYFDNLGDQRLKQIRNLSPTTSTLSSFSYEYDIMGQITKWTQQADSGTPQIFEFQYDPVDQLLNATLKDSVTSAIVKRYVYGYDKSGNRLTEQIDNAITKGTFNNVNQLTSQVASGGEVNILGNVSEPAAVTVNGTNAVVSISSALSTNNHFQTSLALSQGTNSLTIIAKDYSNNASTNAYSVFVASGNNRTINYDANGNLTNMLSGTVNTAYSWDAADQLVKISTNGTTMTDFLYDGDNRRVANIEWSGGTATTNRFLWCGDELCQQRNAAGDTVVKQYFPQGERQGTTNLFYTLDHLFSVREMVDSSGTNVVYRAGYDPYGKRTISINTIKSDFGYTSHFTYQPDWMAEELVMARYRNYRPDLAQWISDDLLEFEDPLNNRRRYVRGNPINYTDPWGLDATTWWPNHGRSFTDGPRNGNWGGKNWSGGKGPGETGTELPPTDSADEAYQRHDNAYGAAKCSADIAKADKDLVDELKKLPADPKKWPKPPKPGTEGDSSRYRKMAITYFDK